MGKRNIDNSLQNGIKQMSGASFISKYIALSGDFKFQAKNLKLKLKVF